MATPYDEDHSDDHYQLTDEEDGEHTSTTATPNEEANESLDTWKPPGRLEWLLTLVTEAKGAATKQVVYFIKKFFGGTKLIFVTGQTGAGKTTILRELTGLDLEVGWTMNSGTRNYRICPAVIKKEQYLFIDTGGFGAADMDDMENFEDILECLNALGPFVTVAGLLLVCQTPQARHRSDDIKMIRWAQCLCGPAFFRNITFVTSKWDEWSPKSFQNSWERLETQLLPHPDVSRILAPQGRYHGGSIYHHGFPGGIGSADSYDLLMDRNDDEEKRGDELRKMIDERYGGRQNSKPAKLQVVREMDSNIPRLETEAAKALRADVVGTNIYIHGDRAIVRAPTQPPLPPPPPSSDQENNKNGKPFSDKFWGWFEVCRVAAEFFKEARKRQYESNNNTTGTKPVWSLWASIKGWWWGEESTRSSESG
ncbi:uncharacterized protein A1O5_00214 [Cladophialophora psammophila CBS 110553]|uniref:Uncharacterized protein n=1 Tax=Cladophialophora psammophila CBS 110553 TaxID=1182543 RepID=W9X5D3_9EURO|nr:uncharacterized protein A1O5_00214 [Cladophialophora psammophila CBS 110553]EXJ75707.1 hypothetical protein A1O5_00214 [Cladophialophora psammophila CBS 110553]